MKAYGDRVYLLDSLCVLLAVLLVLGLFISVNDHEIIDIVECLLRRDLLLDKIRLLLVLELPLYLLKERLLLHALQSQLLILLLRERVVASCQLALQSLLLYRQGA